MSTGRLCRFGRARSLAGLGGRSAVAHIRIHATDFEDEDAGERIYLSKIDLVELPRTRYTANSRRPAVRGLLE